MTQKADQKLRILYRLESGCLGPKGEIHVNAFCQYAKAELAELFPNIIEWNIEPRLSLQEPETNYQLINKSISREQARTYLNALGKDIDDVEAKLFRSISDSINHYLGRM